LTPDGYTLVGTVYDEETGLPLSEVEVLSGWVTSFEYRPHGFTDEKGTFTYYGFPGTAPSREMFRFQKTGYQTKDVAAKSAVKEAPYRYRLEVDLAPSDSTQGSTARGALR
jgi:hypothetical protein